VRLAVRPANGLPLYRQLMEQIQRLAASGGLRAGDALPSVRELSRDLGINPATIAKAYQELERSGLVVSRRGLGTFLAAGTSSLQRSERLRRAREAAESFLLEVVHLGLSERDAYEAIERAAARLRRDEEKERG
jgi:GntR family transcriptional regulator